MRKNLALILLALSNLIQAQAPIDNIVKGTTEDVTPAFTNPYKNAGNIAITFPHQPPLVPHSIRGLQVSKNVNQCLGCHSPEFAPTTGVTRIPETHFMDRNGNRTQGSSPRRYFCLQCHVQQTDVNPIVQNKFETIRQTQGK